MILLSSFSQNITTAIIIIVAVSIFIFWLWMFIDAIRFSKSYGSMAWAVIIGFFGFIGALIYYFVPRKKRLKEQENPLSGIVESD